jgi:hypothetical protein
VPNHYSVLRQNNTRVYFFATARVPRAEFADVIGVSIKSSRCKNDFQIIVDLYTVVGISGVSRHPVGMTQRAANSSIKAQPRP